MAFATLTVGFPTATIVWIAFIIVWQRFEDYVVQPLVYGKALRVNPIVTIVSVLAGAALLGILGALLAIPTAAAIQIVLREWWSNRQHPDPIAQSPPMQLAGGRVQAAPTDYPRHTGVQSGPSVAGVAAAGSTRRLAPMGPHRTIGRAPR